MLTCPFSPEQFKPQPTRLMTLPQFALGPRLQPSDRFAPRSATIRLHLESAFLSLEWAIDCRCQRNSDPGLDQPRIDPTGPFRREIASFCPSFFAHK